MDDQTTMTEEFPKPRRRSGLILILLGLTVPLGTAVLVSLINDTHNQSQETALSEALSKKKIDEAKQRALVKKLETERRALLARFQKERKQVYQQALSDHKSALKANAARHGKRIDIDVIDMDLKKLGKLIATKAGLNILVDPKLEKFVTLELRKVRSRHALDIIAKLTDCRIEQLSDNVLAITAPPKVSAEFSEANIRTVFLLIAAYTGKNIVLDPNVVGRVSLSLKDTNWDTAVAAIVRLNKLYAQQKDGVTIISGSPFDKRWGADLDQANFTPESKKTSPLHKSQSEKNEKSLTIEAVDKDLRTVASAISIKAGVNILVAPGVEETITVKLTDLPWQEALMVVAKLTHCDIEEFAPGILALTQPPKVTLDFNQANIHTVLLLLAAYSDENIVIDQNIVGQVTLSIRDARWNDVFAAIAKTCHIHVQTNKDVIIASKTPFKKNWGPEFGEKTALPESKTLTLNKTATLTELAKDLSKVSDKPILAPEATDKKFTVKLGTVPWRVAVKFIEEQSQTELIENKKNYTFKPTGKNFFIAQRVPTSLWLNVLAAMAKRNIVSETKLSSHFTGAFYKASAQRALEATAHSLQLTVEDSQGILKVHSLKQEQNNPSKSLDQSTEITVRNKKYKFQLQATLGDKSWRCAIISGKIYTLKRPMLDNSDEAIPIRVAEIHKDFVKLDIYEKDDGKPSRSVTLRYTND